MDINKKSLAQTAVDDLELEQHLAKVRKRIDSEDLSTLELRLKYKELFNESNDDELDDSARFLAQAESEMLVEMIGEASVPAPDPADMVQIFRDNGNHLQAETLERALAIQAQQERVDSAFEEVQSGRDQKWGEAYQHRLDSKYEDAVATLKEMQLAPVPAFEREKQAQQFESIAKSQIAAGSAMQETQDADVRRTADELISKGHEAMGQATQLRQFVPSGAVAPAESEVQQASGAGQ